MPIASRRLLCLALLLAAAGLACGRSSAPQPPAGTPRPQSSFEDYSPDEPFVHQAGKILVGPDGSPLKLRGVNLGGWLLWEGWEYGPGGLLVSESVLLDRLTQLVGAQKAQAFQQQVYDNYITEADIRQIAELGFNSVRIPINAKILEDENHPYVYLDSGWQILDRVLGWCEAHHVYAVLDMHAVPGGQSRLTPSDPAAPAQLIWRSPENQDRTVALWKAIAARYRDRQIVAGYDLINEPLPPKGEDLLSLEQRIVAAIREVDRNHLVIVEGGRFSSDFSMFTGPISGNEAYGFHIYTWFGDNRSKVFAGLRNLTDQQDIPLWAGEFGENDYEMIATTVQMFEDPAHEINGGWSFWTWKKVPGRHPALVAIDPPGDWTAVMAWISDPKHSPQPSADQAWTGMQDFIQAVRLENTHMDPQMLQALTAGLPSPQAAETRPGDPPAQLGRLHAREETEKPCPHLFRPKAIRADHKVPCATGSQTGGSPCLSAPSSGSWSATLESESQPGPPVAATPESPAVDRGNPAARSELNEDPPSPSWGRQPARA